MKVKFLPQEIELEIEPNQTVLDLAQKNGIFIKTVCNGVPNCAECRVKLVEGEHNVLPPSSKELTLIGSGHFIDRRRLSCQLYCFGDITIDVSEQVKKETEGPPGSRRFQVELRNEGIVSKAVTGNLIQQDHDLVEVVTSDVDQGDSRPQRGGGPPGGPRSEALFDLGQGGGSKGGGRSGKRGRDGRRRNRDGRGPSNQQRQASSGGGGQQGGGGSQNSENQGGNAQGKWGNRPRRRRRRQ